jgi:hypothetical protein
MIIIILIITIALYLIFTDSVQGNSKKILIVVTIILTISVVLKTGLFSGHSKILDSPVIATTPNTLKNYKYTSNYSLSTWIYVNDWNLYNGSSKEIIKRNSNGPRIYLDAYENQLNIEISTNPNSANNATVMKQTINIPNINTQKWVNVTCTFSNTNIDTYINGKLVDTTIPQNALYYPSVDSKNESLYFHVCPNGIGYSGFISNTNYYPKVLTPQDAWNIYKKGYSSNMFGNLLNKYNATFTFYNNGSVVSSFPIM